MLIKIVKHDETDLKHLVEIRLEQEEAIKNSFNFNIEINKSLGLAKDEVYTMAYRQVKDKAIELFKKIEYVEEEDTPIDFTIVSPKANTIRIIGADSINKTIGKDICTDYVAQVFDQYGFYMKDVAVKLDTVYEGVELVNGKLSIKSYSGQLKLISSYYSHLAELIVDVVESDPVLSEQEIIMNSIAELYELLNQGTVN